MIEVIGSIATVIAIAGVILNNRKIRACFWLWLVSNTLSMWLHLSAGIYSLAIRDLIFTVLAIEGLLIWKIRKNEK